MNPPDLVAATVLGVVEGMTEFIPVSSTGHLIVAGDWLNFTGERAKTFEIFIQLGAILAIVWLYRQRFLELLQGLTTEATSQRFAANLFVAFLPAAIVGVMTHHWIKAHLLTPVVVAVGFIVGGVVILVIEWWKPPERVRTTDDVSLLTAFGIGVAQVLALILPGFSRSGATIMGGYALGLSRTAATEFSFFLAVPVIAAAAVFDLLKSLGALSAGDLPLFAIGLAVAFASAIVVVRAFLRYVAHHSFSAFAWYRIGFGLLLLWLYAGRGFPTL